MPKTVPESEQVSELLHVFIINKLLQPLPLVVLHSNLRFAKPLVRHTDRKPFKIQLNSRFKYVLLYHIHSYGVCKELNTEVTGL